MKNNRYFIVGLFIILITAAMIFIGFWLAFGLKNTKYNIYTAHFHESVNGLNVNAPINYNGVGIGKVQSIEIDRKNPSTVIVTMQIQQGIPIFTNTYASLVPQGITGQVYISLSLKGKKPTTLMPPKDKPPYPEIQTKASFLTNIVDQMSLVATQITKIATRINQVVSDDNVKNFNEIIANLQSISANFAKSSKKLDSIMDSINKASQSIAGTSKQVNMISQTLQNQTLQAVNNVLLPQMHQTLSDVDQGMIEFTKLLQTLNQNPSALIRGKAQHKPGAVNE
ncbi:MlaD family protein [Facilibium subflavum]|uniref:MlaD family protein n=1 Tax=Facilibium subflavum TaxID=2219058 RepID=UPI000E6460B0|nr:MlaD family protein [Facilibium subflavum]